MSRTRILCTYQLIRRRGTDLTLPDNFLLCKSAACASYAYSKKVSKFFFLQVSQDKNKSF